MSTKDLATPAVCAWPETGPAGRCGGGFLTLLTRGFCKLSPGGRQAGIPGLRLGVLELAGGTSREEGELGPSEG